MNYRFATRMETYVVLFSHVLRTALHHPDCAFAMARRLL